MRLTRSGVLVYALPVLAIVVLTILLTITLIWLAEIQRAMRNDANANMVWVIYQTHIESLKLGDAVQHRLIDPHSDTDIGHRYRMLLSRIDVLTDGPQERALQAIEMAEVVADQASLVLQWGERLQAQAERANYEQLRGALDAFSAALQVASNKAMVAQWEEAGARIDTYRNAVLTIFFLMIGILVGSAFISIQLLLALKRTRDDEHVRQRKAELQKELENERKISELYRSFGSMVSHQFRTPLAIIDAAMQRLIRTEGRVDHTEVVRRAGQAREATLRLNSLIENILQADRFMEQLEVAVTPCSLAALARQAVAEQKAHTPAREIQLETDPEENLTVQCDPVLTTQIIGNLLSNAIKYSADDTAVSVRVYREGGANCCAVRDEGRGISPQDLPHIFKRYFRAWTATDVVGTGIGLHIASELAALQQGAIRVQSEPGAGSTFVLCLPASGRRESR